MVVAINRRHEHEGSSQTDNWGVSNVKSERSEPCGGDVLCADRPACKDQEPYRQEDRPEQGVARQGGAEAGSPNVRERLPDWSCGEAVGEV